MDAAERDIDSALYDERAGTSTSGALVSAAAQERGSAAHDDQQDMATSGSQGLMEQRDAPAAQPPDNGLIPFDMNEYDFELRSDNGRHPFEKDAMSTGSRLMDISEGEGTGEEEDPARKEPHRQARERPTMTT